MAATFVPELCHPAPSDLGQEVHRVEVAGQRGCVFRSKPNHFIVVCYQYEESADYRGWFGRRHGDFATADSAIAALGMLIAHGPGKR